MTDRNGRPLTVAAWLEDGDSAVLVATPEASREGA